MNCGIFLYWQMDGDVFPELWGLFPFFGISDLGFYSLAAQRNTFSPLDRK